MQKSLVSGDQFYIVGDMLMEINVFTPGGLGISQDSYDEDFAGAVIRDLERKVRMRAHYPQGLPNKALACL